MWRPTKRALDLGQADSLSLPVGRHGRLHMRVYREHLGCWRMTVHYDRLDPDRSWLHALGHFIVDMLPWFLKGMPR